MPHFHVPEVLSFNGKSKLHVNRRVEAGKTFACLDTFMLCRRMKNKDTQTGSCMYTYDVYHNGESMSRRKCASLQCEVRILTADAVWQDYAAYL